MCSGAGTRGNSVSTPFRVLLWNVFEAVLKWLVCWVRSHTIFVSITSLGLTPRMKRSPHRPTATQALTLHEHSAATNGFLTKLPSNAQPNTQQQRYMWSHYVNQSVVVACAFKCQTVHSFACYRQHTATRVRPKWSQATATVPGGCGELIPHNNCDKGVHGTWFHKAYVACGNTWTSNLSTRV